MQNSVTTSDKSAGNHRVVAVITGSTRGIGFGLAQEFIKRGCAVIINGRSREACLSACDQLTSPGKDIDFVSGDVTNPETHEKILEKAIERFGHIDYWINNAGISNTYAPVDQLDPEEIKRVIEINLSGSILGSAVAIRQMKSQGYGYLFNLEGLGSDGRRVKGLAVYGSTKRAIRYLARSLNEELKGSPVKSGTISPGMVRTDMLDQSMEMGDTADKLRFEKILSILGEEVEVVAPFIVDNILKARKKFVEIRFLTGSKVMFRFLRQGFKRR